MSHVDDGALHAYLDGALDEYPPAEAARIREHLEGCPACSERLEEERSVRARAHDILGLAAPQVELPSFEELRAYVERTRPAGPAIPLRSYRMRLAASVVLALGTGWLLRGGVPGGLPGDRTAPAVTLESEAPPPPALTQAPAEDEGGVGVVSLLAEEDVAVATGSGTDAVARAASTPIEPTFEEEKAQEELDVAASRRVAAAEAVVAPEPAMATGFDTVTDFDADVGVSTMVAEAPAVRGASADAVELGGEPVRTGDVADGGDVTRADDTAGEAQAGASRGAVATEELASADVTLDAAEKSGAGEAEPEAGDTAGDDRDAVVVEAVPESAVVAEDERPERARSEGPPVRSALEQSAFTALRAPAEEVDAPAADVPSLSVAGYEVVRVTNLGEGTEPLGTLVVQRFEDGSTFEVYHLEPDVPREVLPAPDETHKEASVLAETGWIVLRGPREAAELQLLLDALFPPG